MLQSDIRFSLSAEKVYLPIFGQDDTKAYGNDPCGTVM